MEGGERDHSDRRRRRITLWDQMSAVEGAVNRESSTGLTLSDILSTTDKQPSSAAEPQAQVRHSNRTLLDVIREQDPNAARSAYKGLNINTSNFRDKKSWKTFKDKLRLKRAGAAWTSSVPIPASDIPIQQQGSLSRRNSVRFRNSAELTQSSEDLSRQPPPPQILRRNSTRYSPGDLIPAESTQFPDSAPPSFVPQTTRHNSTRFVGTPHHRNTEISSSSSSSSSSGDDEEEEEEGDYEIAPHTPTRRLSVVLAEERALSAREAVAAQEAAERERQEQLNTSSTTTTAEPPVRMSLMDLMDYNMDDDDDADDDEEAEREENEKERNEGKGKEEEEEAEEENGSGSKRGGEYKCCVCMVRHKGSAFIPCGHTFCRLCSRELMVSRGNCPLCNRFILEILDIF
ncbi:hypothetical protein CMV_002569 [Castanea mollissima]|uniref:RING-type domain-containing protein n=1 Tax=Castanea mollissima TaxID=60419 RepID=A0A8J4S1W9_9ROSI|nr:hypothetical protein CMV_002569 [Castanea mollissima]